MVQEQVASSELVASVDQVSQSEPVGTPATAGPSASVGTSATAGPSASVGAPVTAASSVVGFGAGAWWVPTWYVLLCAVPLAGAFFLPVPLMMVMRASRPPIDFVVAGWVGIAVGWALWAFAVLAWFVAGWLFRGHDGDVDEVAAWWRRTTQMWIFLVLAWGAVASVGIWVFYLVVGHTVGLDSIQ